MKNALQFFKDRLFILWLLYIILISILSYVVSKTINPIVVTPVDTAAIEYKYIFENQRNEFSYTSAGALVSNVYVIAKDTPKNVLLNIRGEKYSINNHVVYDSVITKNFIAKSTILNNDKAFRVTDLPTTSILKLIKRPPFFATYHIINYSYNSIWLILFSPLLLLSVLTYVFSNRLIKILDFYNSLSQQRLNNGAGNVWYESFGIVILVLLTCILIEYFTPYYFLQDDNFSQFYPYLIRGMDSIYQDHNLPLYNFNQLNGTPNLGYTTYSYFNPLLHVAYYLCLLLNNKFLLIDLFACLNLLLSAVFINLVLRCFNVRFSLRVLTIFNIIFSGFALVIISSWYYIAPYLLLSTIITYIVIRISKGLTKIDIRSSLWIGLIYGMFIYGGNIQLWVYNMLFFILLFIGCLYIYKQINFKQQLFFLFRLFAVAVIIGAPNIILGILETKGLYRDWNPGDFGLSELWGFIVTIPNYANLQRFAGCIHTWNDEYHFFQIGITGSIGFIISIVALSLLLIQIGKRQFALRQIDNDYLFILYLSIINIIFLLLAVGIVGILYDFQKYIPFINKFNLSFKYLLFFVLISNLIGALIFNTLFANRINKILLDVLVYFMLLIFIVVHIKQTKFNLFKFNISKEAVYNNFWLKKDKENIYLNKYLSLAPLRSHKAYFSNSLQNNFATQYDLFSVNAYEPLNPRAPISWNNDFNDRFLKDHKVLKRLGINRLIFWKEYPYIKANDIMNEAAYFANKNLDSLTLARNLIFENATIAIYKVENADPLLFYYKDGIALKNIKFNRKVSGNSLAFNLSSPVNADSLVVNFDYNPRFKILLNNQELDKKLIKHDTYNRIILDSKKNKNINSIVVKYSYFN